MTVVESDLAVDLRLVGGFYQELLAVAGSGILTHTSGEDKKQLKRRGLISCTKKDGSWIYAITPYCKLLMARLHRD